MVCQIQSLPRQRPSLIPISARPAIGQVPKALCCRLRPRTVSLICRYCCKSILSISARNIDSKMRSPRFDYFKFEFHSICSMTFATISANLRLRPRALSYDHLCVRHSAWNDSTESNSRVPSRHRLAGILARRRHRRKARTQVRPSQ
jgi:hypothetical protein